MVFVRPPNDKENFRQTRNKDTSSEASLIFHAKGVSYFPPELFNS